MKTCMNCVYYNCKLHNNYNVETNDACIYWTDKIKEVYPTSNSANEYSDLTKTTSNNNLLDKGLI